MICIGSCEDSRCVVITVDSLQPLSGIENSLRLNSAIVTTDSLTQRIPSSSIPLSKTLIQACAESSTQRHSICLTVMVRCGKRDCNTKSPAFDTLKDWFQQFAYERSIIRDRFGQEPLLCNLQPLSDWISSLMSKQKFELVLSTEETVSVHSMDLAEEDIACLVKSLFGIVVALSLFSRKLTSYRNCVFEMVFGDRLR